MHISRRELLSIFLGAPFAAACRTGRRELPPGEIVGQDVQLGHTIRDRKNFEVPADAWRSVQVAIIGGGVAGLSAARKLKQLNIEDFVVLELEKAPGGTSISGEGVPTGYPWGAHYMPVPFRENQELVALLDEMSLTDGRTAEGELLIKEEFLCRDPEERIFFKGRWYDGLYVHAGETDDERQQYARFQAEVDRWVNWRDAKGRRAFIVPSGECSEDEEATSLDRISFAEWLRQNSFTSERLLWYCDYACRDDYGLTAEQTSAWAGLFYFCSRVRKSGEESQPFITFPEGNGRFVKHLASTSKARILTSHLVVSVIPHTQGVDVVCLADGQIRGFHCEEVIYASPIFTAPYVIRGFADQPPFVAGEFVHNSWFVANLFLKDRPKPRFARDFPLAWDNVLYDSPSLGYVNATHQKGIDYGPTIFTYYYPMCREESGRSKLFDHTRDELADVCLADLSRAHPDIYALTERLDIMRWGHAMISPRPGFIWGKDRLAAMRPYRNIHFAHTDLSGVALFEEAFDNGVRAAKEVARVS